MAQKGPDPVWTLPTWLIPPSMTNNMPIEYFVIWFRKKIGLEKNDWEEKDLTGGGVPKRNVWLRNKIDSIFFDLENIWFKKRKKSTFEIFLTWKIFLN